MARQLQERRRRRAGWLFDESVSPRRIPPPIGGRQPHGGVKGCATTTMDTGKAIFAAVALYLAHSAIETHWLHPTPRPSRGLKVFASMSTTGKEALNMQGTVEQVSGRWVRLDGRYRGKNGVWIDWSRVVYWRYIAE